MSGALIEARRAALGYGTEPVLADIDLTIEPGEFLGILGPNGAGKTTLFRGLLGLIRPLSGSIQRGPTRVGYVPQQERLDAAWPLSVLEIVTMGLRHRVTRRDHEQALVSLERVGLADRSRSVFADLSGGQRQRVLIARALMGAPQILCLDEPTSGVDRPNQVLIMELLATLNQAGSGPAILVVAHELELLGRVARGALWVDGGRVLRIEQAEFAGQRSIGALFETRHREVSS